MCMLGGVCADEGHMWRGDMHSGGICDTGSCVAAETVTAADGTHPTEVHSCLKFVLKCTNTKTLIREQKKFHNVLAC